MVNAGWTRRLADRIDAANRKIQKQKDTVGEARTIVSSISKIIRIEIAKLSPKSRSCLKDSDKGRRISRQGNFRPYFKFFFAIFEIFRHQWHPRVFRKKLGFCHGLDTRLIFRRDGDIPTKTIICRWNVYANCEERIEMGRLKHPFRC